jgi:hypothetical protein
MTIDHRLAHSGFTLTRDYPVPVEDKFWTDGPNREEGTRGLLDALGTHLG